MQQHFNNDAERLAAIKKARLFTSLLLIVLAASIGILVYLQFNKH